MGLKQTITDPCLLAVEGVETVIIAVYVDDIPIGTETTKKMKGIKTTLSNRFDVKDLGELTSFLSVHVKHDVEKIWIQQPGYRAKMLEKFGMANSKPVITPVETSMKLKTGGTCAGANQLVYQSALAVCFTCQAGHGRTFAASSARHCADPKNEQWIAVKSTIRYLKGTVDNYTDYVKGHPGDFTGHGDADWAGDLNDRKSTSGYVAQL